MNKIHIIGWMLIVSILTGGTITISKLDFTIPKKEPLQIIEYSTLDEVVDELEQEVETSSVAKEPIDIDLEASVRATFRQETGNGTSKAWNNKNNAGGIMINKYEYVTYTSKEEGYNAMRELVEEYYDKYGTNFREWRRVYCGVHCGEKDLNEFLAIFNEEKERLLNEEDSLN